ncbi:hypothetical protein H0H92_012893, partial [Tricholoma furcatifolium]
EQDQEVQHDIWHDLDEVQALQEQQEAQDCVLAQLVQLQDLQDALVQAVVNWVLEKAKEHPPPHFQVQAIQ